MKYKLIKVFSDSSLTVTLLNEELENVGIAALIQDDFNSGVVAGFSGGVPSSVDLFIQEADIVKAQPVISEFTKANE